MHADMEISVGRLCARMEPKTLEAYTSLCNSHKTDGSGPLTGIMRTNGFDIGIEDLAAVKLGGKDIARYSCTGALSSRINHR